MNRGSLCVLQICITASQMQWTADVTKALILTKERGDKRALKSLKKKQVCWTLQRAQHTIDKGSNKLNRGNSDDYF